MTIGVVSIGKWTYPPPVVGGGVAVVDPSGGAKIEKKTSKGKSNAVSSFSGKEVGDVKITLTWAEKHPANAYTVQMLTDLSPRGPNAGDPQDFNSDDAAVHQISSIIIEKIDGPKRAPGTGQATAEITATSWTKPAAVPAAANAAKTPTTADQWTDVGKVVNSDGTVQNNFGQTDASGKPNPRGFGGGQAPSVKPNPSDDTETLQRQP